MNCIIVDDDETSRIILSNLVNKIPSLNLMGVCKNTKEAREVMEKDRIDLLLLDIEMPEETGVEFFESLNYKVDVIYITSQGKHAVRAFENGAIDYLMKPITLERIKKAIEKARRYTDSTRIEEDNDDFIFIKHLGKHTKVFFRDISYVEATEGYLTFYLTYKKIVTSGVLKKVEEKLVGQNFIRVHRSFLVNIHKISSLDNEHVYIEKEKVPLSRMYKKEVMNTFKNRML